MVEVEADAFLAMEAAAAASTAASLFTDEPVCCALVIVDEMEETGETEKKRACGHGARAKGDARMPRDDGDDAGLTASSVLVRAAAARPGRSSDGAEIIVVCVCCVG